MINIRIVALAIAAFTVISCTTTAPPVQLTTRFDPADFAWAAGRGTNTIQGNAVLRTVGGEIRTCAGLEASLLPVAPYSAERMRVRFGSEERGMINVRGPRPAEMEDPPGYQQTARKTVCDSQGNFEFKDLPDGSYYASAVIVWGVPSGSAYVGPIAQGGRVMSKVTVAGGQTAKIVLTQPL